jgi:hypothetical protein
VTTSKSSSGSSSGSGSSGGTSLSRHTIYEIVGGAAALVLILAMFCCARWARGRKRKAAHAAAMMPPLGPAQPVMMLDQVQPTYVQHHPPPKYQQGPYNPYHGVGGNGR